MKYCFGDIVVVEQSLIGVVVKTWVSKMDNIKTVKHDVYVRELNKIISYQEEEIQRYMVRHKYLSEE